MKYLLALTFLAVAVSPAVATVAEFGQCGGQEYTGDTVCITGTVCTVLNPFFFQCLLPSSTGTVAPTTTTTVGTPTGSTTSTAPGATTCANRTKFKFFGVNQSGAEFGNNVIPGTWGKDFTFPAPRCFFVGKGFNFFRVPFQLERMVSPTTGLAGPLSSAYLANYTSTFWTNLAGQFKSNSRVIFDVMNEPNGIAATTVFSLNQAAVNGIRASGATTQMILVEAFTGAWTWVSSGNGAAFAGGIKDPNNNVAIQMHQYLDSDGSGTNPTCVSSTIGAERLANATAWLQQNNMKGFLGEIGAGSNSACISAVFGAFCQMQQSGVWIGASWWAAGPWWPATYFTSIEPPNGLSIPQILPQALMPFL
ncbi:endoglucanase [Mycena pura]|uniref:cellulase n=1 Tax=Mycena pura TaxID=153505 RepID=A0AAD6YNC1_9AGAR|nr:endoglucanase [Mycena pura]